MVLGWWLTWWSPFSEAVELGGCDMVFESTLVRCPPLVVVVLFLSADELAAIAAAAADTIDRSVGNMSECTAGGAASWNCRSNGMARRAFHWSQVRPAMRVMLRSSAAGGGGEEGE